MSSDHNKMVKLTTVNTPNLADVIRIGLADEGIDCIIDGEGQAGLTGALPIRILVRAEDEARAREILAESGGDAEE